MAYLGSRDDDPESKPPDETAKDLDLWTTRVFGLRARREWLELRAKRGTNFAECAATQTRMNDVTVVAALALQSKLSFLPIY